MDGDQSDDQVPDDGLIVPEVGYWSATKHELIETYAKIFATATKKNWQERVYLDPYAGAGYCRTKGSTTIRRGLPLRALGIRYPFDRYVFGDKDAEQIEALRARVQREHPTRKCFCEAADANTELEKILQHLPRWSKVHKVLTLCVLDPFNASDLRFATIERIAARRVDFIVLVPTGMEFSRLERRFHKETDQTVSDFTGDPDWRSKYTPSSRSLDFGKFVLERLAETMHTKLGYLSDLHLEAAPVKGGHTRRRLYHLALFSKAPLAVKLWRNAVHSATGQTQLFSDHGSPE